MLKPFTVNVPAWVSYDISAESEEEALQKIRKVIDNNGRSPLKISEYYWDLARIKEGYD
jgi:hypothetical protein